MTNNFPFRGLQGIPNLFTLLNLVFGCIAIVFILQNGIVATVDESGTQLINMPEKIWIASLFIGLAALVDFFDGFIARLFKVTSEIGKQLDSLADVVSFGVAPGMIIYQFLRLSYAQQQNGLEISFIWLVIAFLIPAAAAYRLAIFNIGSSQQYSFKGVPTPAVGLVVASLPLIYWNVNEAWAIQLLLNKWFLYALILLLSYLMVSTLPMMSLKFKEFSLKNNLPKYILLVIAIISIIALKWPSVPVIFIAYILVSLLFKNKIA
ncbi:MAG TPA: CDP-alcohol phosphatidyltransferase family protein [Chitinophagaceae bacterium]|nr:CDP-alcohol phosphatidyltransferase family protein [Chitinophagaceae bacterium]